MTDEPQPGQRPSDITRLLFKAVKGLPEDEQRAVFEYFLARGTGLGQPPFFGPLVPAGAELASAGLVSMPESHQPAALAALVAAQKPMVGGQVTIPVRISAAQHRRLKDWCAEHNFPMAVVVRGLVERFLDGWDKRAT